MKVGWVSVVAGVSDGADGLLRVVSAMGSILERPDCANSGLVAVKRRIPKYRPMRMMAE